MPGGKIHDAITIILAPIAGAGCYLFTRNPVTTIIFTGAFLLGALMFGPDLDTDSRQFARWWIFRPIWLPYKLFFSHRSRWTHGLLFGSLLRVVYFVGLITLGSFAVLVLASSYAGATMPSAASFEDVWQHAGNWIRSTVGLANLAAAFIGLWAGAASHTFTDLAGTYIKTGRIGRTL